MFSSCFDAYSEILFAITDYLFPGPTRMKALSVYTKLLHNMCTYYSYHYFHNLGCQFNLLVSIHYIKQTLLSFKTKHNFFLCDCEFKLKMNLKKQLSTAVCKYIHFLEANKNSYLVEVN